MKPWTYDFYVCMKMMIKVLSKRFLDFGVNLYKSEKPEINYMKLK